MFGERGTWVGILVAFMCLCSLAELGQSKQDVHERFGHSRNKREDEETGVEEDKSHDSCKIIPFGKHPWIIRFKFYTGPDPEFQLYTENNEVFDNHINLTDDGKNHHTLMTGALITPLKVLTTTAWSAMYQHTMRIYKMIPKKFLWMYGYNYQDACSQRRYAIHVVWHPRSMAGNLGNLGDFGLYTPWEPFDVEGEPFLLQKPHPISEITNTIDGLIAKPEKLLMFLFEVDESDSFDILDEAGSMFTFIGLPACREMPNFMAQEKVRFDPDTNDTSFFCGDGIPGTWNRTSNGSFEGRGSDGASGAVAFYNKGPTPLPLGLYEYWIGPSGEPRFFAAFTQVFFDWLDNEAFGQTNASTDPSSYSEPTFEEIYPDDDDIPPGLRRDQWDGISIAWTNTNRRHVHSTLIVINAFLNSFCIFHIFQ